MTTITNTMVKPTFQKLVDIFNSTGSVNIVETEIRNYLNSFRTIVRPTKPILSSNASPTEIREHADKVERYEVVKKLWDEEQKSLRESSTEMYHLLEGVIKDVAGLKRVPYDYREKVYAYAYSEGSSDGYGSVYNKLVDLIAIFE